MRTIINRNASIDILASRRDRIVVAADVWVRGVTLALPASGQFFQAKAGYLEALARSLKPAAAGAARALDAAICSLASGMPGLSRLWHTHCVMPRPVVVPLSS